MGVGGLGKAGGKGDGKGKAAQWPSPKWEDPNPKDDRWGRGKGVVKDLKGKGGETGKGKLTKGVKTCKMNAAGLQLCKMFNDGRGCQRGSSCTHVHECDVMKADGTACGMNHPRIYHRGPTLPLGQ